jgi:hypothetical protein
MSHFQVKTHFFPNNTNAVGTSRQFINCVSHNKGKNRNNFAGNASALYKVDA